MNFSEKILSSYRLTRIVTPSEYLKLLKNDKFKDSIIKARFVSPRLGSNHLGKVLIQYKHVPKQQQARLTR